MLFAAPVNTAVLHQVVTAQLAARRTGTHDTRTRGEVRGGGKKPYRQKGTGRARQGTVSRAALPRRWRRLRAAPALVRAAAAAQDEAPRAARRADRQARRRAASRSSTPSASTPSRPRSSRACCARSTPTVACWSSRRPRPEPRDVGAQPADGRHHPGRLAQRRRPHQRRPRADRAARARRACRRCTRDRPDCARDHPAPGHQREVDRRVDARQVHVRCQRQRQQDPDQGGRGRALQEGGRDRHLGQRPDHQSQGKAPRHASAAASSATPRPGARPSSPWPPARRSNSSRGSDRCRFEPTSRPRRASAR